MREHLPLLSGTPAQVFWAEQVRDQKIAEMERYADSVVASTGEELDPNERVRLRDTVIRRFAPILAQTNARYWVNLAP